MFAKQLPDLTDDELERLENIVTRMNAYDGDKAGLVPLPADCAHLRDFIAFVERDVAAFFSGIAEASR